MPCLAWPALPLNLPSGCKHVTKCFYVKKMNVTFGVQIQLLFSVEAHGNNHYYNSWFF